MPEITRTGLPKPVPAYLPTQPGLYADRELYTAIHKATEKAEPYHEDIIAPKSGKAWKVPAGHVCRIYLPEGPQVGDLNIWNQHNPRERLWASRTRQLHAAHVTTFDRLWSTLPYLRPLVTITGDSINYGLDDQKGRCHDLLGTRCDPYIDTILSGQDNDFHCHSNLTRAVLPYGLTEFDVHDVLNVFQVTGLDDEDRYFMQACPGKKGDYFEFFAEIDVLCALSACPGGDLSQWGWGETEMDSCCRPLGFKLYKVDPEVIKNWKSPEVSQYKGKHGLGLIH